LPSSIGSRIAPLTEQALLAIYHGQQEHAWSKGAVEAVERALEGAGLYRRLDRPPAVCFLDLTGYTQLPDDRGDEAAATWRRSWLAWSGGPPWSTGGRR
jgi:class 3 adenylate cyclase